MPQAAVIQSVYLQGKVLKRTIARQALEETKDYVQSLHEVLCMLFRLVLEHKLLDEAGQHWQQTALLLIIVQQPAHGTSTA